MASRPGRYILLTHVRSPYHGKSKFCIHDQRRGGKEIECSPWEGPLQTRASKLNRLFVTHPHLLSKPWQEVSNEQIPDGAGAGEVG
jgi:hypothetical protein